MLLEEWGIQFSMVRLLLDNAAAISIAENGSTWRTRYFGVRGSRINEEIQKERLLLGHQPTKAMVADGLTKLGSAEVLQMVRDAMNGEFPPINLQPMPTISAAHTTSVSPGKHQAWDVAGDGPTGPGYWNRDIV